MFVGPWGRSAKSLPTVSTTHKGKAAVVSIRFRDMTYSAMLRRKIPPNIPQRLFLSELKKLDEAEISLAKSIATAADGALQSLENANDATYRALDRDFDELSISKHIEDRHGLTCSIASILSFLHKLAEQSYENKSLTFGIVIGNNAIGNAANSPRFPEQYERDKKYKALSDGFRTAYLLSTNGLVRKLIDVAQRGGAGQPERGRWFPEWCEDIALSTISSKCAFALTRQGDIAYFERGTMRFTYRGGKWQFWNHGHIVGLLAGLAKVQRIARNVRKQTVSEIYRQALDISFRRSGGLYVVIRNRNKIHPLVRIGDALEDSNRDAHDRQFDSFLVGKKIAHLPRRVLLDLASIDGAVVLSNSGEMLAYGAVLETKARGAIRKLEGSRTKAAIGASHLGLAVKISSDGDITFFFEGDEYLKV